MPRATTGVPKPILTPMQKREQIARRTAAALGYNECVTYSFIDQASAALFGGGDEARRVANPISQDMTHLRPSHLAGLCCRRQRATRRAGFADLSLFEVGAVFHGGEPEEHEILRDRPAVGATGPKDVHGSAPSGRRVRRARRCRSDPVRAGRAGQDAVPRGPPRPGGIPDGPRA